MSGILSELIAERGVLLADGATGSNLFAMGLQTGDAPELWNDLHPERITRHYRSFIDAGCDIILTNTFGGSRYRLKLHDAAHRVGELNGKGARIAREQVERAGRRILIGGSMGPTGEILEPLGSLSIGQAAEAFEEQAVALRDGGVDLIWAETLSSREEAMAAVMGVSRAGLPVVTTFSIDTNGRTMMGLTPADIVQLGRDFAEPPLAIGANCGVGPSDLVAAIVNMRTALGTGQRPDTLVIAKANCGVPQYIDGGIVYSGTREIMAEYVKLAVDAGADVIGGCCGSTPEHLKAMRAALDGHVRRDSPTSADIERGLGEISAGARAQMGGDLSIAGGAAEGEPGAAPGAASAPGRVEMAEKQPHTPS